MAVDINKDDLVMSFEEMTSIALWAARRAKSKYYRDYSHRSIRAIIETSGINNEFTQSSLAIIEEELAK